MINGRFGDTSGSPYVSAVVHPHFSEVWQPVSFLIDTGADTTILAPTDLAVIGMDFDEIRQLPLHLIEGVGGLTATYEMEVILSFRHEQERKAYMYDIKALAVVDDGALESVASILGRDVIHRWMMNYNYPARS